MMKSEIFDKFDEILITSPQEGIEIAKILVANGQKIYKRPRSKRSDYLDEKTYLVDDHLWYKVFCKGQMWRIGKLEWERMIGENIHLAKEKKIKASTVIRYFKLLKLNGLQ